MQKIIEDAQRRGLIAEIAEHEEGTHSGCMFSATLMVTGGCSYTEEEISAILAECSLSICKAYKEIDGLVEGTYDRDSEFKKIIYT